MYQRSNVTKILFQIKGRTGGVLPETPSEGWGREGTITETQQSGHAPRSGPEVKMEEVGFYRYLCSELYSRPYSKSKLELNSKKTFACIYIIPFFTYRQI